MQTCEQYYIVLRISLSSFAYKLNVRAGTPAAPRTTCLLLLPFGPDRVHRTPPRRTRPDGRRIPRQEFDVNVD